MKKSFEVPVFNEMMCELFQAMKELGGSGTIREIDDKTIEILGLPAEVQEIMHGNSSKTEVEYRLAWTRTYMKKVGILENSSRGVWSLTAKGREMEQIDPKEVVQKVREMTLLKTKGVDTINIEDDNLENDGVDTPDEIQSWREKLKTPLVDLVSSQMMGLQTLDMRLMNPQITRAICSDFFIATRLGTSSPSTSVK